MRSFRILVSFVVVGGMLFGTAADATAAIRFTEIQYESPGPDDGSNDSLNAEFVVIKNTGNRAKRMGGWKLVDKRTAAQGGDVVFRFPSFRLRPGRKVTVHTGRGTNTRRDLYWGRSAYTWGDDSDTAYLYNRAGKLIDRCTYTSTTQQTSPPARC